MFVSLICINRASHSASSPEVGRSKPVILKTTSVTGGLLKLKFKGLVSLKAMEMFKDYITRTWMILFWLLLYLLSRAIKQEEMSCDNIVSGTICTYFQKKSLSFNYSIHIENNTLHTVLTLAEVPKDTSNLKLDHFTTLTMKISMFYSMTAFSFHLHTVTVIHFQFVGVFPL